MPGVDWRGLCPEPWVLAAARIRLARAGPSPWRESHKVWKHISVPFKVSIIRPFSKNLYLWSSLGPFYSPVPQFSSLACRTAALCPMKSQIQGQEAASTFPGWVSSL